MIEYPIDINVKVGIDWHKACLADRERLANVRDWLNHEYQRLYDYYDSEEEAQRGDEYYYLSLLDRVLIEGEPDE